MNLEIVNLNRNLIKIKNGEIKVDELMDMVKVQAIYKNNGNEKECVNELLSGLEKYQVELKKVYKVELKNKNAQEKKKIDNKLLTRKEAMKRLNVCDKTLYNYQQQGLKYYKPMIGNKVYFYENEIEDFIKSRAN